MGQTEQSAGATVSTRDSVEAAEARFGATPGQIREILPYVPSLARRYNGCGLPLDELIAAGNLGVVEAALRFDPTRRVKFVTYANWWIRKAILEAIEEQTGPMRLPRYQHEKLRTLAAARAELVGRHGSEPGPEQLARVSGMSRKEVDALLRHVRKAVSLDQPPSTSDRPPMHEILADRSRETPQGSLIRRDLAARMRLQLIALEPREQKVLRLRFGLDTDTALTLRETAACIGISRERVRQVELQALLKLRQLL